MTPSIAEAPFPPQELTARLLRVRRELVARGIDALIVMAPDSQYWLCGLESFISSALLAEGRLVKSANELALLRRAGAFADAGLQAALGHARPGVTERRLAAEIEYAMRSAGSDYPSIPTELTSGPRSVLVHGTPSHRILEAGDLVHVEVGGGGPRHNAVRLQTFHIGGRPAPSPR